VVQRRTDVARAPADQRALSNAGRQRPGRRHAQRRETQPGLTAAVQPRSEDVLEAGPVIASLERRLRGRGPVAAQGVALVRLLLIDGNGALYRPSDPGALADCLRAAAAALSDARD
jgi:hypothetical protein